jgi:polyisoprenoid-binding protein YceI
VSTTTRWVVDLAHSSAEFRVPHFWGLVKVKGQFDRIDGWLEVDHNGSRRLELTIDANSVNTGNRQRDEHLRGVDFFDTDRHPDVRFVSSRVSEADDGDVRVQGELVAAGDRVALELQPTVRQSDDQIEIDVRTTVDQRQLGMTWSPLGIARTPTVLTVHAHLRRQP